MIIFKYCEAFGKLLIKAWHFFLDVYLENNAIIEACRKQLYNGLSDYAKCKVPSSGQIKYYPRIDQEASSLSKFAMKYFFYLL